MPNDKMMCLFSVTPTHDTHTLSSNKTGDRRQGTEISTYIVLALWPQEHCTVPVV